MRMPPTDYSRYQETEGVPGDMSSPHYPNPVDAFIANQLAQPTGENPQLLQDLMRRVLPTVTPPMSPQEYIQQQFEQLQPPDEEYQGPARKIMPRY